MNNQWLAILGVGEEGLAALSPIARAYFAQAKLLVGGKRHLAMLPSGDQRERLIWGSPIRQTIQTLLQYRNQPVCVLASGDPLCYGIGTTLLREIPLEEMVILPAPSAFSLACARLGWSLPEVETVSLCGRHPAFLHAYLYPGAKILLLSADRTTPALVAQMLTQAGYGSSLMTVLVQMGSDREQRFEGMAEAWDCPLMGDLNVIAIALPRQLNLARSDSDSTYEHDGQLTKREIRAITLSSLAPQPGQLLWDVGAGNGSIAITWMRHDRRCQAIAIEMHPQRLKNIAKNAETYGVPNLHIIAGKAPEALQGLPQPDAIFIGGGVTAVGMLETCWQALPAGGRLVVNAVTIESEVILLNWQRAVGGNLIRVAVQRAEPLGKFLSWKALAPITQWVVVRA
jgi:precorrin-6B C5,15-methyltransferase / cobalt-precorrin-6B C5,C15-methyltransferase